MHSARLSAILRSGRSRHDPEDILVSDKLQRVGDWQDGSTEGPGGGPSVFSERPAEHLEAVASPRGAQPRDWRTRACIMESVATVATFRGQCSSGAGEVFDVLIASVIAAYVK